MLIRFWTHSDDSPSDVDQFVNYKVIKEPTSQEADESLWKPWMKWTMNKSSQAPCPLKEQYDCIIFKKMYRKCSHPFYKTTLSKLMMNQSGCHVWGWGNHWSRFTRTNDPKSPSNDEVLPSPTGSSSQPISTLPSVADAVNIPPIGSFWYAWN